MNKLANQENNPPSNANSSSKNKLEAKSGSKNLQPNTNSTSNRKKMRSSQNSNSELVKSLKFDSISELGSSSQNTNVNHNISLYNIRVEEEC